MEINKNFIINTDVNSFLFFNYAEWNHKMNKAQKGECNKLLTNKKMIEENYELYERVNALVEEIERLKVDLTQTYDEWRNVGFALADGFGEQGRNLFHRLSKFYPDYDSAECDKQYNKCLNSYGSGITINTLFYYAMHAGIVIAPHLNLPYNSYQDNRQHGEKCLIS